jgi:SAM-dependent methyltransferase
METVVCELCGSAASQPFLDQVDRFSGQKFLLAQCRKCGLVYLNPRPTQAEVSRFYPEGYEAYQTNHSNWHTQRALDRQLAFVNKHQPKRGRLLDIGCATGEFLATARQDGWEVLGVEVMESVAESARKRHNLPIIDGSIDNPDLPESSFDAVTLWDVLEHLPQPVQAMQTAHRLLRPGGVVIFSIPNLQSFDRYLFGKKWIGWDPPRHFNLFDKKTVSQLLRTSGFQELERSCFLGGKGALLLSLDFLLKGKPYASLVKTLYPAISALLWPYRQFSYWLDRGPIVAYVARKTG